MKNQFLHYIKHFYHMDKKGALQVIFLKIANALLFSVETMIIADLIDKVMNQLLGELETVFYNLALFVLFLLVKRALGYLEQQMFAKLKKQACIQIYDEVVEKKGRLSYLTLEKAENQELIRRIGTETAEKFCEYFENEISLLGLFIEMLGLVVLMTQKSVALGVGLLLVMIPYFLFAVKNGKYSYEAYEESEEIYRRGDYFQSILKERKYAEERTLFQYGDYFNARWEKEYEKGIQIENAANLKIFKKAEGINIFATIVIGILAVFLMGQVMAEVLTIGFAISILKSLINYIDKVSLDFAQKIMKYENGTLYFYDYQRCLSLEEGTDKNEAEDTEIGVVERIEFRDVSFSYPGCEKKVFEHLNLVFETGKQYALVGENGAGKTTLLKLLTGIYDTYEGQIFINGLEVGQMKPETLRNVFAYVPQEITKYEVDLGEYLQTSDKEKIAQVFQKLKLDFLQVEEGFPLLGRIEESGKDLSGGQWQLLAIARAILANKQVNILDEPTAAIDPVKEATLYNLFREIMQERFSILVTHRLGAAKMADEIVVMGDGKVLEQGCHQALMQKQGIYSSMYNTQRKWYEENEK